MSIQAIATMTPALSEQTEKVVNVEKVSKVYHQGDIPVHALQEVSLLIRQGEFTALVGPSGSGKTTLLNLIGALDAPTSGDIWIGQENLTALSQAGSAQLRLNKIGFVFQDYSLLPVLTALENVEYVLQLQGMASAERRRRAEEALVALGLHGCLHRRPAQLSGGQQQRVAIARAIVSKPLLVLADEPTANLDSDTGASLLETMRELNRKHGTTFIFSTHDPMVMANAQRIVRLKDGKIIEDKWQ